jgi:putative ABC transport system permease protein
MGLVNLNGEAGSYLSIRYEPGKSEQVTSMAKQTWEKLLPGIPVTYSYMDDDYKNLYRNEIQTRQVFAMLALLAIIVAILGILGLASFMAQRRTREIAIRKVSGAGVVQIIRLLNWKFIKWVLISFVLACPVAWWVMNRWLQDFVYRISLNAWIFILSGTIALALVIITVSMVTLRAASVNPAESMKYE